MDWGRTEQALIGEVVVVAPTLCYDTSLHDLVTNHAEL
jgi:hypothetical protein